MGYQLFLLICFLLSVFQCSGYGSGKKSQDFTLKKLVAAPDTVTVDGVTIILETYLWRDFMPVSPPNGKPMRVVISLLPTNSDVLPLNIDARRIWVIFQKELWSSSLESVGIGESVEPRSRLEKMAANGPKWGPGVEVTVVVEVIDGKGKSYLLKCDRQIIHRTD